MKKIKTLSTFLGGVLIGGILLGSLSMAKAEDSNSTAKNVFQNRSFAKMVDVGGLGGQKVFKGFKGVVSNETIQKLVQDKVITQEKADEIKAFVAKQEQERIALKDKMKDLSPEERQQAKVIVKGDLFSQLVENKILTAQKAEEIQAKLKNERQALLKQKLTEGIQKLVQAKTITQDQGDIIIKQFDEAQKEKESFFEKTKDMTMEERHQFMQDNKNKMTDPIEELVAKGVITEIQAQELQKILPGKGFGGHRGGPHGFMGFNKAKDFNGKGQMQ